MTTSEILRRCTRTFEFPSMWTRQAFARTGNGVSVHHDHPAAVAWSVYGLVAHVAPTNADGYTALWAVVEYLGVGSFAGLIRWGNDPERTAGEVVDALRAAADAWDASPRGSTWSVSGDADLAADAARIVMGGVL